MEQDLFKNLPSEITTDILSRLDLRATAVSKCICKSWLELLESHEFVKSHLSRSAPALAVLMPEGDSNWFTLFEFDDELDLESHDHRYNQLTKFDFPRRVFIEGSSDGLLFLRKNADAEALYVCNPITREYIELPFHEGPALSHPEGDTCGFGVSKITGQHKLVCIIPKTSCHVYTLGSESWRRVEAASVSFRYSFCTFAAFVNCNLHWIVSDSDRTRWISCFDLETECFTTFSVPPVEGTTLFEYTETLSSLKDCLCLCDKKSDDEIVIWLMKEYGVEKSWTREYVVSILPHFYKLGSVCGYPIKVFEDGDILMVWDESLLFFYSNKTKTTQVIDMFDEGEDDYIGSMLLTPSFLSLKSFGVENVISF